MMIPTAASASCTVPLLTPREVCVSNASAETQASHAQSSSPRMVQVSHAQAADQQLSWLIDRVPEEVRLHMIRILRQDARLNTSLCLNNYRITCRRAHADVRTLMHEPQTRIDNLRLTRKILRSRPGTAPLEERIRRIRNEYGAIWADFRESNSLEAYFSPKAPGAVTALFEDPLIDYVHLLLGPSCGDEGEYSGNVNCTESIRALQECCLQKQSEGKNIPQVHLQIRGLTEGLSFLLEWLATAPGSFPLVGLDLQDSYLFEFGEWQEDSTNWLSECIERVGPLRYLNLSNTYSLYELCEQPEDSLCGIHNLLSGSTTLEVLHLARNPFDDEDIAYIAQGLAKNSSLRILTLDGCLFGQAGEKALADALAINHTLEFLYLGRMPDPGSPLLAHRLRLGASYPHFLRDFPEEAAAS